MSTTLSGSVKLSVTGSFANVLDLSTITEVFSKVIQKDLTNGTGANKAQVIWSDQRTLTTGANETLDLAALAGAAFGTAAMSKVKAIIISMVTTTTGYTLQLTAGASNGFSAIFADASDVLVISNGGFLALAAPGDGYTVDSTHKTIKLTNPAGGSCIYDIIVIGEGSIS